MSKQQVMEDLDALLADLQSTSGAAVTPTQKQPGISRPVADIDNHYSGGTPGSRTTPSGSMSHGSFSGGQYDMTAGENDDSEPLYEMQNVRPSPSAVGFNSHFTTAQPSIYAQSTKLMRPTPAGNSVPGNSTMGNARHVSTLSSNLSELDSLLQELSSAQFSVEVDRRNNAGVSPSVAYNAGPAASANTSERMSTESFTVQNQVDQKARSGGAASSATRELDDLMASLTVLSTTAESPDLPYASSDPSRPTSTPQQSMSQAQSLSSMTDHAGSQSQIQVAGGGQQVQAQPVFEGQHVGMSTSYGTTGTAQPSASMQNSNLNAMMADLDKNMTQQGVTTVAKGHCAACTKPIVGQVITALGRLWHPEHFTCAQCKEQIGTRNFFERDTLPYCERDYHLLFSPRCAYCNGPVLDKCVTALDKTWHPEHFCCTQCGKQLGDEDGFQEKDGRAYCREDYFEQFAPKCGGCGLPIVDSFITALSRQWHPPCFVCLECRTPFGASSFFDHEGMPYCETHFHAKRGSLCAGCRKPITGRCITAMYKKFHPEHFVCTFCQRTLNKGTFKEQNEKPYCHPCFVRLFS